MSSPIRSYEEESPEDQPKGQEQISFRFCRECSNMLYPKEDRLTSKLMFACRTCQFSEEAQSSCVFRNNMYNTVGETAGVTQDVGSDPTVGCRPSLPCPEHDVSEQTLLLPLCCMCGCEIGDEEEGDGFEEEEDDVAMDVEESSESSRAGEQTKVKGRGFNMASMAQMEEEEEEEQDEDEGFESGDGGAPMSQDSS